MTVLRAKRAAHREFSNFARGAAAALAAHSLPIAADISRALARAAEVPESELRDAESGGVLSHFPPAGKHLRARLEDFFGAVSANDSPLCAAAARLSPHLFWRAAGNGKTAVAAAELVGPSGVVECSRFRAGLFFQPANMFYQWHRHEAEEIYLPLGGAAAEWHAENAPPVRVPPLQFVHHRSWQPHAMRTFDSPLCALWGWRGGIAMEHYELCAAPRNLAAPAKADEQKSV